MVEGISSARVLHGHAGKLPVVIRPGAGPVAADANAGGFFRRDSFRNFHLEISLNDFGLEESYGRFVKDRLYAAGASDVVGSMVDLYV